MHLTVYIYIYIRVHFDQTETLFCKQKKLWGNRKNDVNFSIAIYVVRTRQNRPILIVWTNWRGNEMMEMKNKTRFITRNNYDSASCCARMSLSLFAISWTDSGASCGCTFKVFSFQRLAIYNAKWGSTKPSLRVHQKKKKKKFKNGIAVWRNTVFEVFHEKLQKRYCGMA